VKSSAQGKVSLQKSNLQTRRESFGGKTVIEKRKKSNGYQGGVEMDITRRGFIGATAAAGAGFMAAPVLGQQGDAGPKRCELKDPSKPLRVAFIGETVFHWRRGKKRVS